jgi:hypothetical protein
MRWPRSPASRKFSVRLVVRRAEGLPPPPEQEAAGARVAAEVRWKGPRASALGSLRRGGAGRRNCTREAEAASWDDEFESVVTLAAASQREGAPFQPWELAFCVFRVSIESSPPLPSTY